jgi:hypothetical protein
MIGAAPILTEASWSKGRYDSYVLYPDGLMICNVHPPGLAWMVNKNDDNLYILPDEMTFISTRNQSIRGRYFVAALLPRPFPCLKTGSSYQCELILVMGVQASASKLLMKRNVNIYYFKMKKKLGKNNNYKFVCKQTNSKRLCI